MWKRIPSLILRPPVASCARNTDDDEDDSNDDDDSALKELDISTDFNAFAASSSRNRFKARCAKTSRIRIRKVKT